MTIRPLRPALAAALCLALPVVAGASIPGNIEQRTRESLLHVCTDTEPDDVDDYIVCSEQVGGDPQEEYTGSECVTAGLPASCVPDFIPKVKLKATLLLVQDEDAENSSGGSIEATGLVLQLKKGKKKVSKRQVGKFLYNEVKGKTQGDLLAEMFRRELIGTKKVSLI